MRYPEEEGACIYCKDLTDAQIEEIRITGEQIQQRNKSLGLVFLYLFTIALLVILGVFLR
jgi:hypothetical protein